MSGIQTEAIGRLKRQHRASLLYTIPAFHNPTGTLMSSDRRAERFGYALRKGALIEDDVYGDLWLDSPRHLR